MQAITDASVGLRLPVVATIIVWALVLPWGLGAYNEQLSPAGEAVKVITVMCWLSAILTIYFLPTVWAWGRPHAVPILLVNLFLGWTV